MKQRKQKHKDRGRRWTECDGCGPEELGMPVLQLRVAGIDVGSKEHWVCAPTVDATAREVAVFGCTTPEVEELAAWLKERGITSVAMESTGVYWIPLHEILEREGFQVLLVSTRELARVPGRKKTDNVDCKWIQRLHSCGLLRGSFRPPEQICKLRTLVRDKGVLLEERADWLRRIQKTLDQMNVRVHRAVSDIQGKTGMAIIRAIVAGQRDSAQLAKLRDPACRLSEEEIAQELTGHWREDYLFSLQKFLRMYDGVCEVIADYEKEILRVAAVLQREDRQDESAPPLGNRNKAKKIVQRGEELLRQTLFRVSGADLSSIDGVGVGVTEAVLSEYGPDLTRFPDEKAFISHLTLAPRQEVTGGKPIRRRRRRGTASSRVREALLSAVQSLQHSSTALGAYFRHLKHKHGPGIAGFATARKLATLIYRMLRHGRAYVDEGCEAAEQRYVQLRLRNLKTAAAQCGYQLTPAQENA